MLTAGPFLACSGVRWMGIVWGQIIAATVTTIIITVPTYCLLCRGTELKCFLYSVFFNFPLVCVHSRLFLLHFVE